MPHPKNSSNTENLYKIQKVYGITTLNGLQNRQKGQSCNSEEMQIELKKN